MSTETLAPDAILVQTLLDGAVTDIDESVDSPDGNWCVYNSASSNNTDLRVSFPSPTGDPNTGADLQAFRAWVRKTASGGNSALYSLELWENGSEVAVLATGEVTSTSGEEISGTWNAASLSTADGSAVECRVSQTSGGSSGPGGNRRRIETGAVEWVADYTASSPPNDIAGQSDGTSTVAVALSGAGSISGTSAGAATVTGAFSASAPVAGQSDGVATTSGEIAGAGSVAGESAGATDVAAAITGFGAVAGTAAAEATVTGSITGGAEESISGTAEGASAVSGELAGIGSIAGQSDGVGTSVGEISGESSAAMAGVSAGSSTVTMSLFGTGRIWGMCDGLSSATASITDPSNPPPRHCRSSLRIGIR
jgi:hypothetical protein